MKKKILSNTAQKVNAYKMYSYEVKLSEIMQTILLLFINLLF